MACAGLVFGKQKNCKLFYKFCEFDESKQWQRICLMHSEVSDLTKNTHQVSPPDFLDLFL